MIDIIIYYLIIITNFRQAGTNNIVVVQFLASQLWYKTIVCSIVCSIDSIVTHNTLTYSNDNYCILLMRYGKQIGISGRLQTVGSDIIKALEETKSQRSWQMTSMRQTSEEPFGKIMAAAVKMAEDMNTAVS